MDLRNTGEHNERFTAYLGLASVIAPASCAFIALSAFGGRLRERRNDRGDAETKTSTDASAARDVRKCWRRVYQAHVLVSAGARVQTIVSPISLEPRYPMTCNLPLLKGVIST